MKYVILQGDGMVVGPHPDLGGKTPLEAASTPNMDFLANHGEFGLVTVPMEGVTSRVSVMPLAILGYDPRKHPCGPAPFEAAGLGVALGEQDVAFRCSMVTLRVNHPSVRGGRQDEIKKLGPHVILEDETAGAIETEEARELMDAANEQLGSEAIQFYPGTGHRHLMVWVGGKARATCFDPREAVGQSIGEFLPTGDGADILKQVMEASLVILQPHPVNEQRVEAGLKPANCLWLWGQGKPPKWAKLTDQHRITGTILSADDLSRGVGIYAGLETPDADLPGKANGTDFPDLAETTLRELAKKDLVYVHAEMPAELVRRADVKAKVKALEDFDRKTVGPLLTGLQKLGAHRLLLLCGPAMSVDCRTREPLRAPYVLYEGPRTQAGSGATHYNEAEAEGMPAKVRDMTRLVGRLLPRG